MGVEDSALPRLASGFGGGIGGAGATCGALVGAVMAVGLIHGRDSADGDRQPTTAISRQIHHAFEQQMGSTSCRELTGLDLTTPEGGQALRGTGVSQRVCRPAVDLAANLALEQLQPDQH
jgi:C_GCAxxG_C_C family probable redox protein